MKPLKEPYLQLIYNKKENRFENGKEASEKLGVARSLISKAFNIDSNKVAERIHQNLNYSKLVSFEYDMGLLNKDKGISQNVFIGLSLNPNLGGVIP